MLAPNPWFRYQIGSGRVSDVFDSDTIKLSASFLD